MADPTETVHHDGETEEPLPGFFASTSTRESRVWLPIRGYAAVISQGTGSARNQGEEEDTRTHEDTGT